MEFKRGVVGELERKVQLCREHGLAEGQIHKWRKLFGSGTSPDAADTKTAEGKSGEASSAEIQALQRKVAEFERLCGQITLENAYLKNSLASACAKYPKEARMTMIVSADKTSADAPGLSVHRQCELLKVPRSTHYYCHKSLRCKVEGKFQKKAMRR